MTGVHTVSSGKYSSAFYYTGDKSIYSEAEVCGKKIRKSVMLVIYSYFSPPPSAGPTSALMVLNID